MERWKKNLWTLWVTQTLSLASFGFGLPLMSLYIQTLEVMTPERVKVMTALLVGVSGVAMGIMAPIWGYLADRLGRKLMIVRAMFFAIFILCGMGLARSVNHLLILRIMQGLFTGTITASSTFIAANTPKKHLTYALGIIASATSIGYSIGPFLGGMFAEAFGYRMSFIFGGILMAFGTLIVIVFLKEDRSTLIKKTEKKEKGEFFRGYKEILIPVVVLTLSSLFLLRIARSLFSPYLALLVASKFNGTEGVAMTTGLITAGIGIATAVSSALMGTLASKYDKMKLLSLSLLCGTVIMILLNFYTPIARVLSLKSDLWVFGILYSAFFFVIGGTDPIISSTAAMNVKAENRGALFGLRAMVGSIAWFTAPMISGAMVYSNDIEVVLIAIPVVLFINFILSFFIRRVVNEKEAVITVSS